MLETIREFAIEQLGPDETEDLGRRHAEYFATFAETAASELGGFGQMPPPVRVSGGDSDEARWLDRVWSDVDNFRSAFEWARVRAEAKARFDALQARIRPHFLFNSMNTIASLIRVRPAEAEHAVENLSDLFRAALGSDTTTQSTLGEELDLVRRYLDIEKLRLGERLRVDIDVHALPADLPLPALLLQPLVENAVYHGVQQLPEGGTVTIRGQREGTNVAIEIRNPCPPLRAAKRHGMALENTRARIEYHFGARGALKVDSGADYFACVVTLPLQSPE